MTNRGFTGTRQIPKDRTSVVRLVRGRLLLLDQFNDTLVIGCCHGMDAIIGSTGHEMGFDVYGILPFDRSRVDPEWITYCNSFEAMPDGSDYMDRNQRIVDISIDLTAFPRTHREERSGTWSTVWRARKKGIPIIIIPINV